MGESSKLRRRVAGERAVCAHCLFPIYWWAAPLASGARGWAHVHTRSVYCPGTWRVVGQLF